MLISSNANAGAYRAMVDRNGVHLVIIYEEWFVNKIPASWIKVASMDQSRACIDCSEGEVQFYATDAVTAGILRPELQAFRKVLPPRVKLKVYGLPANAEHAASMF
jgi:hypothetical protein